MSSPFFRSFIKRIEIALRKAFIAVLALRTTEKVRSYPLPLSATPTILFLRQDRLGDAIVSTPLLVAVKRHLPQARIIMVLGKDNQAVAKLLPVECEILVYKKKLLSDLKMLLSLRSRNIEVAIDLMDNPSVTSSAIIGLIGAKYSIGVEKDNSAVYSVTVPALDRFSTHISTRIAELLRPLGIDPSSIQLQPTLASSSVKSVSGRVGLNLSAGSVNRELSVKQNADICLALLTNDLAQEILLLYHPKDIQRALDIKAIVKDSRINTGAKTADIAELTAQLATCESIITPDTSIVHIAAALSIPLVGIYTLVTPKDFHSYWTPIGVPYEMIIPAQTFEEVTAETVLEAFRKLMNTVKAQSPVQPDHNHVA